MMITGTSFINIKYGTVAIESNPQGTTLRYSFYVAK